MHFFLVSLVAGVAIGSIYGLVAIGYTVVFNATRVFNLAQGELVMVGVMASYLFLSELHWPQWVAFVLVVVGVGVLALIEERLFVRPFLKRSSSNLGWFISTLGFSLIVQTAVRLLFGNRPISAIPSPFPLRAFEIGGVTIGSRQLFAVSTLVVIVICLELFFGRTVAGWRMSATAEDRDGARFAGINVVRVGAIGFGLSGLVAGVSGFVLAPLVFSDPSIGLTYTLKGFLALAIGGFGSIRGAIVGGLLIGVGEQMFDLYIGSEYNIVTGLLILLAVLSVRPEGIFRTSVVRNV